MTALVTTARGTAPATRRAILPVLGSLLLHVTQRKPCSARGRSGRRTDIDPGKGGLISTMRRSGIQLDAQLLLLLLLLQQQLGELKSIDLGG